MNKKTHRHVLFVAQAGIIAALYVVLTWLSALFGLSGQNAIQIRVSEALCVLPYFTLSAVPGLTVGCLLANLLTGAAPLDVVFGTLATLIGAVAAALLRRWRFAAPWPNVVSNTLIVPFVVFYVYYGGNTAEVTLPYLFLTVFIGEFIAGGLLGTLLMLALYRRRDKIFPETYYRRSPKALPAAGDETVPDGAENNAVDGKTDQHE